MPKVFVVSFRGKVYHFAGDIEAVKRVLTEFEVLDEVTISGFKFVFYSPSLWSVMPPKERSAYFLALRSLLIERTIGGNQNGVSYV